MAFQQIVAASGPLPIKAQFNSPSVGSTDFIITGTAWANAVGQIGLVVSINGAQVGTATVYANATSSHMTLPTLFVTVNLPTQQGTIVITPATGSTVTDFNDTFVVNIEY